MSAPSFSVRQALSFAWRRTWSNFWQLLLVALVGIAIYVLVTLVSGVLESLPVDAADPSVPDPTELLDDPDTFLLDPAVYRTNPLTYLTLRNGINLVVTGLQVVVTLYLFLGLTRIAVAVTAGAKVEVSQLFAARGLGRYVGGTALHALLLVVGIGVPVGIGVVISAFTDQSVWTSVATIIGYVIATVVTLGFIFFGFVIADKDSRVVAGMRESHELVRPHILRLLLLLALLGIGMGVLFAVAWLVGTRTAGIGFLISLPVALPLLIGLFAFSTGSAYRQLSGQTTR